MEGEQVLSLRSCSSNFLFYRSGDEYDYQETNADGWSSDTWVRTSTKNFAKLSQKEFLSNNPKVSYLVVISPSGETVFSGVFGDKEGNNAGNKENDTAGGGRSNLLYSESVMANSY